MFILWTALLLPAGDSCSEVVANGRYKVRIGSPCPAGAPRISFAEFDHSDFDALLRRFVDCDGMVAYQSWKCDSAAMCALQQYLERMCAIDYSSGDMFPKHRLATLINAYNALVIWGILREYPTVSIQAHNKKGACFRIFDDLEVCLSGEYVSLNGIEHGLLRPLGDPRIHFAIVCAARGCPRLRNEAFVAERVDSQLDENGFEFFSKSKRWRTNRLLGTASVSPILKWFREDFGHCDRDIINRIFVYLPTSDQCWISERCVSLKYLGYDWSLNDKCPSPSQRVAAIPYTLFARVEPTVRPLIGLINSEEPPAPGASLGSQFSEPTAPAPAPSGEDEAPPPVRLKTKEEEEKENGKTKQ